MGAYKVEAGLQGEALATKSQNILGNVLQTRELSQAIVVILPSDRKALPCNVHPTQVCQCTIGKKAHDATGRFPGIRAHGSGE